MDAERDRRLTWLLWLSWAGLAVPLLLIAAPFAWLLGDGRLGAAVLGAAVAVAGLTLVAVPRSFHRHMERRYGDLLDERPDTEPLPADDPRAVLAREVESRVNRALAWRLRLRARVRLAVDSRWLSAELKHRYGYGWARFAQDAPEPLRSAADAQRLLEALLLSAQNLLRNDTGREWPAKRRAGDVFDQPLPTVEVQSGVARMWYGERQQPVVELPLLRLRLPPLSA